MDKTQIYEKVQERYGSVAKGDDAVYGHKVATAFGYSKEELESIPRDANLGLSCGNPLALAKLKEGETVIDLGSGAGFDVFLAAQKVGPKGSAIGVEMNKDMLKRANQNKEIAKADNVFFVESLITEIALPDATADCIISNCVVNLVPEEEKQLAFNEMFRLLKPGGRIAIADILTKRELPPELKTNMALYVGCIAGASQVQDYEKYLQEAGFTDILIVDSMSNLNVYTEATEENRCCGEGAEHSCCEKTPSCCIDGGSVPESTLASSKLDYNELAGSFKIYAVKA